MPAPVIETCTDPTPHESHFWERDGDNFFEGDPLRWCQGVSDDDRSEP
jgi:hypothetical protein